MGKVARRLSLEEPSASNSPSNGVEGKEASRMTKRPAIGSSMSLGNSSLTDMSWKLCEALQHLSAAGFHDLIQKHGPPTIYETKPLRPFPSLARAIIYQQLAGAAASTIWKRFVHLVADVQEGASATEAGASGQNDKYWANIEVLVESVTPQRILDIPVDKLRSVGLSKQKAAYLQDLATHFHEGRLEGIECMPDDELRRRLIAVKGVGEWTVDMFLIFTAHRPDIFPVGDLAAVKGMQAFLGKSNMTKAAILEASEAWKPYRSCAAWYMYRIVGDMKAAGKKSPSINTPIKKRATKKGAKAPNEESGSGNVSNILSKTLGCGK